MTSVESLSASGSIASTAACPGNVYMGWLQDEVVGGGENLSLDSIADGDGNNRSAARRGIGVEYTPVVVAVVFPGMRSHLRQVAAVDVGFGVPDKLFVVRMEEGVVPLQRDIEVLTVRSHAEAEGPRELLLIAKPFDSRRLAHLVVLQRAKQLGFGGFVATQQTVSAAAVTRNVNPPRPDIVSQRRALTAADPRSRPSPALLPCRASESEVSGALRDGAKDLARRNFLSTPFQMLPDLKFREQPGGQI